MNKVLNKINNRGSSLIELIIAIMIVGLVVTAVAVASTYSIKNTGEARFKQVATTLGQEVIEYFRSEKNSQGFINFNNTFGTGTYCFDSTPINSQPAEGECDLEDLVSVTGAGSFTRKATVSQSGGVTTVTVSVVWLDGNDEREVELIQEFKEANNSF